MTTAELIAAAAKGPAETAKALAGLDEKQRRAVAKEVYTHYRKLETDFESNPPERANMSLLVVGCCALEKAKRARLWLFRDEERQAALLKIFDDRRPGWVGRWLEEQLEREFSLPWPVVAELTARDYCERLDSEGYIRLFASGNNWEGPPLEERLRARPEWLEHEVWRLFEVESDAFVFDLSSLPQTPAHYQTWSEGLARLAESGDLDGARLHDALLQALATDFKQNMLSGLVRFHQRLAPGAAAMAQRQSAYRMLLGMPVSQVVDLGLKSLQAVHKAGKLEVEGFLNAASAVLQLPTKGTAKRLLKLAFKLAEKNVTQIESVAGLALDALSHPSADIGEQALKWLQSHSPRFDGQIEERSQLLPGSLQPQESLPQVDLDVGGIDPGWLEFFGFSQPGVPAPLRWQFPQGRWLHQPVEPLEDLQALIDAATHAVEEVKTGLEVERLLDGLSRFCDRRPDDFELKTQALRHRLETQRSSDAVKGIGSGWGGMARLLSDLLLSWLKSQKVETQHPEWTTQSPYFAFVRARLDELRQQVLERRAQPLLGFPTHEGGWIAPCALVERLQRGSYGPAETIQALLRLAGEGREQARPSTGLPVEVAWALGAVRGKGGLAEVWLAAARARAPRADWSELISLGLPAPACAELALSWTALPLPQVQYPFPKFAWHRPQAQQQGALTRVKGWLSGRKLRPELLVTAVTEPQARHWSSAELMGDWLIRWNALLWPACLEVHWQTAADAILGRWDENTANTAPYYAFLEPLFERDRPWDELCVLVLWLSLLSKDNDLNLLAIDVCIEGCEDGRAHPTSLSEVLLKLCQVDWPKPNRLAAAALGVGRSGPLARLVMGRCLGAVLARPLNKGAHHLMEAFLELNDGVEAATRENLATLEGGSKTARLARKILKLEAAPELSDYRDLILSARVDRARRWSSQSGEHTRDGLCSP